MKTNGNDKSLEAYKIFPFIAWGLTVVFAFFVYNITMELKAITESLEAQSSALQMKVNTPVEDITNFET
jgi:cell division protein FtsN